MSNISQVLLHFSNTKFSYNGTADCCVFAGAVVKAIHGYNPMASFDYTNRAEAIKAIRKSGDLVQAVTEVLGEPLPMEGVEDGDILAAMQTDGEWIVGVALGGRMAVKTKASLMDWPLEFAEYRWRSKCPPQ